LVVQFFDWAGHAAEGDLGRSSSTMARRRASSIDGRRDDPKQIDSFLTLAPEAMKPGRIERKRVA
jgi:hypothetical protein